MSTLADLLIPLAGSISNEKALKMREACDALEAKIDVAQRGMNHAHDLISLLTDRVKELERDNLDRRLTKLERAVDVLDRQRVETLNLRVNGLETTVLELRDAMKNIAVATDETLRAVRLNTGEGASTREGDETTARERDGHRTPSPALELARRVVKDKDSASVYSYDYNDCIVLAEEVVRLHTGEGASTREGDVGAIARDADPSPSPASSVPAPAAPVVDVHRLIQDYIGDRDSSASAAMTRALAAQGVRTKDGA